MPSELLSRAFKPEMVADGRTITGIAIPWNTVARVSDGGPSYLESFAPGSADKTLRERASVPFPLGMEHPWIPGRESLPQDPVGFVRFRSSKEGLLFEGRVVEGVEGDEILGRIQDGSLPDVSVGFVSHKQKPVSTSQGNVVLRTEVALFELSLTANGAYEGAGVLAVREKTTMSLAELRKKAVLL